MVQPVPKLDDYRMEFFVVVVVHGQKLRAQRAKLVFDSTVHGSASRRYNSATIGYCAAAVCGNPVHIVEKGPPNTGNTEREFIEWCCDREHDAITFPNENQTERRTP